MISKTVQIKALNQLISIGLNQTEANVYLESLQLGPASIQEIAKQLNLNRVTVHSAVANLIKKNLLYESRQGKRRFIVAEQPTNINNIINQKKIELSLLEEKSNILIEILKQVKSSDSSIPSVRFYEGRDGFKQMLEQTLEAKNDVLVFTYVDLFSKILNEDYLESYFKRRAAKKIKTKLIFPHCDFANKVNQNADAYRIQIRLLPPEFNWRSGIFSWNNCLAIKSFTEGRMNCTIIENHDIAFFYRNIIFPLCWEQANPF